MKIAISGKGGAGKTTIAAALACLLQQDLYRVLAVDADSNANLALALGASPEQMARVEPLVHMRDLIAERTGASRGSDPSPYLRMNPHVADIPERFALDIGGIRLLVMGGMKPAGSGCACPENNLLRALVTHLMLRSDEVVILDMEAGIEHLTRGTARGVDALLVVTEPSGRSVYTAWQIRRLGQELGIGRILAVGNKLRDESDRLFLQRELADWTVLGFVPDDPVLGLAEREGLPVHARRAAAWNALTHVKEKLVRALASKPGAG